MKVDAGQAGITTDMEGDRRWTISAFDTRTANKNETPPLNEFEIKKVDQKDSEVSYKPPF